MRRIKVTRRRAIAGLLSCGLLALAFALLSVPYNTSQLAMSGSPILADRHGTPLRLPVNSIGVKHIHVPLDEMPDKLIHAFLAAEDERFFSHPGFDPIAIARATLSNISAGKTVSGASTITQQLVRSTWKRNRGIKGKLREILLSTRAEIALSKDDILELYLNRVPMGGNLSGVGIASKVYFGKTVDMLNYQECTLLASLPKAPGTLNPYGQNLDKLKIRRDWILSRMLELNYIDTDSYKYCRSSAITVQPAGTYFSAPHLVDLLNKRNTNDKPILRRTTIDPALQQHLVDTMFSFRPKLLARNTRQAAGIIIDNNNLEVLAYAGSLKYSPDYLGFNDGVTTLRSPGSTLKPLLYGLALDTGTTASWMTEDVSRYYKSTHGEYRPRNYNRKQYGPVRMRVALANSLNLSAVKTAKRVGIDNYYNYLNDVGLVTNQNLDASHYGLGLAIGNMEVTLEKLVTTFAMLANNGELKELRYYLDAPNSKSQQAMTPEAASIITDILSDPATRTIAFGNQSGLDFDFPVALKTGTSNKYRDAWIVGYTPQHTIGVWVGNFAGQNTDRLSGTSGAGPIFAEIVRGLYKNKYPGMFELDENIETLKICDLSGSLPNNACPSISKELFIEGTSPTEKCKSHSTKIAGHILPVSYANWVNDQRNRIGDSVYQIEGFADNNWGAQNINKDSGLVVKTDDAVIKPAQKTTKPVSHDSVILPELPINFSDNIPGPEIIYPLNGDRFVDTGGNSGKEINLVTQLSSPTKKVTWFIDGIEYAECGPPYSVRWKLEKGAHKLMVIDDNGNGDQVSVSVE